MPVKLRGFTRKAPPQPIRTSCLTDFACCFYNAMHSQEARQEVPLPPASGVDPPLHEAASGESEAAVPVHMELKRIIISEVHDQQVIMLKEVDGERSFHIMIGIFEATSIDRRVKRLESPRPLTHDLVASVIENLGGELRDIYISELRDHTYYAKLRIR